MKLMFPALLALILTGCPWNWRKAPPPTEPPRVDCNERAPAEPEPSPPRSDTKLEWKAYARRWQGVATAEVQKRAETADCLDRDRAAGRIR